MDLRFWVWMPLLAVLLVLLSIATLLIYVLPAARARLVNFVEDQTLDRAVAAAGSVAGVEGQELQRKLDLAAETGDGQVLVVDRKEMSWRKLAPRVSHPRRRISSRRLRTGGGLMKSSENRGWRRSRSSAEGTLREGLS